VRRREFITLLGGAAAALPHAARAQQPERIRRIGVLTNLVADDPESQARVGAFLQGLQEFGWGIGRNVRIEYRWGADDADRTRRYRRPTAFRSFLRRFPIRLARVLSIAWRAQAAILLASLRSSTV
jgi:hypothetical protein